MVANIITDVTDWIDEISSNWWFLIIVFAIALLDSVIPIVPSETTVIAGGVAAGAGNQQIVPRDPRRRRRAHSSATTSPTRIGHQFGPRVRRWAERKPDRERRPRPGGRPDPQARRTAAHHRPLHPGRAHRADGLVGSHRSTAPLVHVLDRHRLGDLGELCRPARLRVRSRRSRTTTRSPSCVAFGVALSITALIELIRWARRPRQRRAPTNRDSDELRSAVHWGSMIALGTGS